MGTVVSSTILREDGRVDRVPGVLPNGDSTGGRVTFEYAYGPDLLPPAGTGDEGMWRYRALLPLDPGPILYPLRVGDTPLVAPPELRRRSGVARLFLKDETRSPTGSNKDRATALVLEHALRTGIETVSCASTGNVAVSLAVGAAAAGKRAIIFVPATVMESKLSIMLLAGAAVLKVAEGYDAAFQLSRQAAAAFGWYDRNTGVNPVTLEAKKTVAFEMWEQLGREVPDAVLVPVGDGPTISALAKGFRELKACGATDRLPRLIGVQAEGCQPLKRAWETGQPVQPVSPQTIADGIAVGNPVSADMVLRDVHEAGGGFVAVSDSMLLEAMQTVARHSGVLPEPAAAAGFAGLEPALASGLAARHERIVVLITGTVLKSPQFLRSQRQPLEIHATLDNVERVLP